MPGPGPGKTLTPLKLKGRGKTLFRYLSRPWAESGTGANGGVRWASCSQSVSTGFRRDRATFTRGFYVSNSDLGLIGLGLAAFTPLALAYVGPATAYFITGAGGAIFSSTSVGQALLASGAAGSLAGLIKPRQATFTTFVRPCDADLMKF
jgi:hypothetical protein